MKKKVNSLQTNFKIIIINLIVFLIIWLLIEFANFARVNFRVQERCYPTFIDYSYCPSIEVYNKNHEQDGGETIRIITDDIGGRIQNRNNINNKDLAKFYFIGDSFIQADELDYSKTIYGILNKYKKNIAYGNGYSSWNPIQYLKILKKIKKKNKHYFIFISPNDFHPNYKRSIYYERIKNKTKKKKYDILGNTLFFKLINKINKLIFFDKNLANNQKFLVVKNNFDKENFNKCFQIDMFSSSKYYERIGFDYLMYSKHSNCWDKKRNIAYKLFINEILKINHFIKYKLDSTVTYVLLTAGFAYENENSQGRLTEEYSFSNNIKVSQFGFSQKFINDLKEYDIIDTELLIEKEKKKCVQNCIDKYYFPIDGHLNANSHALIANFLIKKYKINY